MESSIGQRIASRLSALRAGRQWSLDTLASQTGISRATLSRVERGELSPTAEMLGALCAVYGWTLSRLVSEAESKRPALVSAADQIEWTDPASGYVRRIVSPPGDGLRGEMVEVRLPASARVAFASPPAAALEHHLWMLKGTLDLEVEGTSYRLRTGDCLRYVLNGATQFANSGKGEARYVIALVRP
jgi:transcriptional regulator with XRE-family HTH domain